MLSFYNVSIDTGTNKQIIKFQATSIRDAYEVAANKIIEKYDDILSDECCNILDNSSLDTWNEDCDKIYEDCGMNISDICDEENS